MGGGSSYNFVAQEQRSRKLRTQSREEIFSKHMNSLYDPSKINFRESRDINGKKSTPISIYFDVTGSMGSIPERMIKYDLNDLVKNIQSCGLFELPQICFGAISDGIEDQSCIQVTQFESNEMMASHLESIWLEGRGGGNRRESYHMPWLFNLDRVKTDAWEKRNEKGFLFTIGDEPFGSRIHANELSFMDSPYKRYSNSEYQSMSIEKLFNQIRQQWEVFHIHIEHGQYSYDEVAETVPFMKNRLLCVSDQVSIADVTVAAIMFTHGKTVDQIRQYFVEMGNARFANVHLNVIFRKIISILASK